MAQRRRKYTLDQLVSKITEENRHEEVGWENESTLDIQFSRETDGRWIADVPAIPGATVYGRTPRQALVAVEALALRVIADRIENGEWHPGGLRISFTIQESTPERKPGGSRHRTS
jgi:predicted RNase H-like HicB family nuclease